MSSRTRELVADLRVKLGVADPLADAPPLPKVEPPPNRIFPTKRTVSGYAKEAIAHTTALVGIGHVGTRYATDIVLQSGGGFYQDKEGNLFDLPYHEAKSRAQEIFQRRYISLLLERYNNNISLAARKSGITRAALYKILKNLGMDHSS